MRVLSVFPETVGKLPACGHRYPLSIACFPYTRLIGRSADRRGTFAAGDVKRRLPLFSRVQERQEDRDMKKLVSFVLALVLAAL